MTKRVPILLLLGALACGVTSEREYLTSESPAGYRVRLRGTLDAVPEQPLTWFNIVAEPLKWGKPSGPPIRLYAADSRDSPFRARYPNEVWITPNLLRLVSTYGKVQPRQPVTIWNAATSSISSAVLDWGDLIIVCELLPQNRVVVDVPVTSWMHISGHFTQGSHKRFDVGTYGLRIEKLALANKPVLVRVTETGVDVSENK